MGSIPHSDPKPSARAVLGVLRSLFAYYRGRERREAMDRLHARFIRAGDLVFDIGSHVGDRIASFRRLGARVLAVEPQPILARTLQLLYGRDPLVAIEPAAVGARDGDIELLLNSANPTVSSASGAFVAAARNAPGWEGQVWDGRLRVPLTTLDALIRRHGRPAFVKIDIEGFEAEALAGLSTAVPALSFEFTTIQRQVAQASIDACRRLGRGGYRFNAALGESQRLLFDPWRTAPEIAAFVAALPHEANSGDIYASV